MNSFVRLLFIFGMALLAGCNQNAKLAPAPVADLLIQGGKIYTLDEEQPWVEAVAVRNGEIVFVGSNKEAQNWLGKGSQLQDLQGKMLLPGFIDSHAHPVMGGGLCAQFIPRQLRQSRALAAAG